MKINVDRLCRLAGLQNSNSGRLISEASNSSYRDDPALKSEREIQFGKGQLNEMDAELEEEEERLDELLPDMETEGHTDDHVDMEEMIEVDEAMLVQELRRAKRIMNESRKRTRRSRRSLQEQQLQRIIDDEVKNVMQEFNLTSDWVYGNRKPRRSRKGYVNQGSMLKGPGFK